MNIFRDNIERTTSEIRRDTSLRCLRFSGKFSSLSLSPLPSPFLIDSKNARVWSDSRRIPCARRILATRHHRDLMILESPRLKRSCAMTRFWTRSKPAKLIRFRQWKFIIRARIIARTIVTWFWKGSPYSRRIERICFWTGSRNCYCHLLFQRTFFNPLTHSSLVFDFQIS